MKTELSINDAEIKPLSHYEKNNIGRGCYQINENTLMRKKEKDVIENTVTFQNFDEFYEDRQWAEVEDRLCYSVISLSGEIGELSSEVKKLLRGDLDFEEFREKALLEAGDCLGCLTKFLNALGASLEEAAKVHMEKMINREKYGKGNHGIRS